MFRCNDCGCTFEEPNVYYENHGLDYGAEKMNECPNCHSTDYEDSTTCSICGEYAWGSDFCECCRDEAVDMLKIDFNHFGNQNIFDMIDLFTEALDKIYVNERMARKK